MQFKTVKPIPKGTLDKIFDESIKLKEYLDLLPLIESRINYIAAYIGSVIGYEINYITLSNGDREFFGFFNPRDYNNLIEINVFKERGGEDNVYLYEDGFPTRFLHEEFETEVQAEYKKYIEQFPD